MLNIYGSMLCPDCVQCEQELKAAGIPAVFHDIGTDLAALKEFLRIRDTSPLFDQVREAEKIGIPCLVRENGSITLNWKEVM